MTKGDGQSRHNPAQPPQRQPTPAVARPVSRSSPDEAVAGRPGKSRSHRSRNQRFRRFRRGCVEVSSRGSQEGQARRQLRPNWRTVGCLHQICRTCQEEVGEGRRGPCQDAKRASKVRFRTCRGSCTSGRVAGPKQPRFASPTVPVEPQNLAVEVRRMQGVIDSLLRERAQMRGVDAVELAGDQDCLSSCTVALVDEGGAKRPRLEAVAGSGSVV